MTTALAPARPGAAAGRATFAALAARETRRFALNPVFLFAVAITVVALWASRTTVADIDDGNWVAAIFLGGFGMVAAFSLTRSLGLGMLFAPANRNSAPCGPRFTIPPRPKIRTATAARAWVQFLNCSAAKARRRGTSSVRGFASARCIIKMVARTKA